MVQLIASHTSHSIYDTICTIWYNTYHHWSSHVSQSICYNLYNMIQLIASNVSHSIYNIMCTLQYNTYHHWSFFVSQSICATIWYNSLHHMHHTASLPLCVPYNATHIITSHLMYHRASMPQCVQLIYNIMCTIWYNLLHHMHHTASMTPYAQYNKTHIITGLILCISSSFQYWEAGHCQTGSDFQRRCFFGHF